MKKLLATTAIAATLLASGAASAANWNQNNGHNGNHNSNNNHGNWNHSQSQNHNQRPQARHHGFRRGGYLPAQYRSYHEVDWHSRHLRQPPRGYHWVQVDGDTVLVAIAGGLILDALINN